MEYFKNRDFSAIFSPDSARNSCFIHLPEGEEMRRGKGIRNIWFSEANSDMNRHFNAKQKKSRAGFICLEMPTRMYAPRGSKHGNEKNYENA